MGNDTTTLLRNEVIAAGAFSIEIRGDELEVSTDAASIAEAVAGASATAIKAGIRAIAAPASKATIAKRRAHGSTSTTVGVDTGRLANGITVELGSDGSAAVVPPPDRLNPADFRPEVYARFMQQLEDNVPAIADPLSPREVDRAIAAALDEMIG